MSNVRPEDRISPEKLRNRLKLNNDDDYKVQHNQKQKNSPGGVLQKRCF